MISFKALTENLPAIFGAAQTVELPITLQHSSIKSTEVSSSRYLDKYEVQKNEKFFKKMQSLQSFFVKDKKNGVFSLNSPLWAQNKRSILHGARFWNISRLPYVHKIDCFLLSPSDGAMWLILAKGNVVTDFQVVWAQQYSLNPNGRYGGVVANMDSMFGDVGWFPYPNTNYEKTGVFCSVITTELEGGREKVQIFKRRITSEGKIENKALPDGVSECSGPW